MGAIELTPTTGVVVTGGASGIGRACADALAEAGRPVALWDRDGDGARDAAGGIGDARGVKALGLEVDVTDGAAVESAVDESRGALGSLGGVVHAAGIVVPEPVAEIDLDHWDATLAVNLRAFPVTVRALLDDLRRHDGSAVVGIASIEAMVGHAPVSAYCASKAGLVGVTRPIAAELGPEGIRVNTVCPGYIQTPMLAPALASDEFRDGMVESSVLERLGTPEDVARAVRFLLSDEAAFVTGTTIVVDGGVTATP